MRQVSPRPRRARPFWGPLLRLCLLTAVAVSLAVAIANSMAGWLS